MLSRILQNITNDDDWEIIARLCEYDGEFTLDELTQAGKIKAIKKKITANYSVSAFEDIFDNNVYYDQLLLLVAKTMGIKPIPKSLYTIKDFEIIERLILSKYVESMRDMCIHEKGYSFWNEKESIAFSKVKSLSNSLSFTEKEICEINEFRNNFKDNLISNKVSTLIFLLTIMQFIDFKKLYNKISISETIILYSRYLMSINPLMMFGASAIENEITKWKATTDTVLFLAILHLKQINADRLNKIVDKN